MESRVLTKRQLLETLEGSLERSGVEGLAAQEHARGFLEELEGGGTLRFADLGELRLEGERVVVRPEGREVATLTSSTRRPTTAPAAAGARTVEVEASIRELMRGGYSRRQAERALLGSEREAPPLRSTSTAPRFMDALLAGDALSEEVDDHVRGWREAGSRTPLREHLGMRPDEYALWAEQPKALDLLAYARRHQVGLDQLNRSGELRRLAARSLRDDEVEKLLAWLRKHGHI